MSYSGFFAALIGIYSTMKYGEHMILWKYDVCGSCSDFNLGRKDIFDYYVMLHVIAGVSFFAFYLYGNIANTAVEYEESNTSDESEESEDFEESEDDGEDAVEEEDGGIYEGNAEEEDIEHSEGSIEGIPQELLDSLLRKIRMRAQEHSKVD